ncbi:MAG: hypothetical protein SGPRY_014815 [Prymnesium sp.]
MARLDVLFREWDADKSGTLSRAEWAGGLVKVGVVGSEVELEELFNTVDTNRNGEIEYSEIHQIVRARVKELSSTGASVVPGV